MVHFLMTNCKNFLNKKATFIVFNHSILGIYMAIYPSGARLASFPGSCAGEEEREERG